MLPTAATRRKNAAPESGWMLLPKLYVYLGVVIIFVVGLLFGSGYNQANFSQTPLTQRQQYSITKPTVLVTGGLGFIGSHVVEDLLANGFHVRIRRCYAVHCVCSVAHYGWPLVCWYLTVPIILWNQTGCRV